MHSRKYATPADIVEVQQLQKEINALVRKIHNPLYNLISFSVFPLLLTQSWFVELLYPDDIKSLMEQVAGELFSPGDYSLYKKFIKLKAAHSITPYANLSRLLAIESMQPKMYSLVNTPEFRKRYKALIFIEMWPSLLKTLLISVPLTRILLYYLHDGMMRRYPLGVLPWMSSQYNRATARKLLIPDERMKVSEQENQHSKSSLVNLRNKIAATHKTVRFWSRILSGLLMTALAAIPALYFWQVKLSAILMSLLFTTLSNLVNDARNWYSARKLKAQKSQTFSSLNQVSAELQLMPWKGQDGDEATAFFVLDIQSTNAAPEKSDYVPKRQLYRALQFAFRNNGLELLAWYYDQIVISATSHLDNKIKTRIVADFKTHLAQEKRINDPELKELDDVVEREFQQEKLPESTERRHPKKRVILSKPPQERRMKLEHKKDEKSVKINLGQYGIFNSNAADNTVVPLNSRFWPRYTHFGLFAVPEKSFGDPIRCKKFRNVFARGGR